MVKTLVSLLVVALMVGASSAAATSTPTATKTCLIAGGAKLDNSGPTMGSFYGFPEIKHEIDWVVGESKDHYTTYEIYIYFTPDEPSAVRLEGRLLRLGIGQGLLKSEIEPLLGRRGNIAWSGSFGRPPTKSQLALLKHCLAG
jgi:hypothetical protein